MTNDPDWEQLYAAIGQPEKANPFAAAVRATRMPMVITDPRQGDNPIVFVNDAFIQLTGYRREEIVGRNCRFLQGPGSDPVTVARIREAVTRRVPIEVDLLNHKKNGDAFWNKIYISPVFDGEGIVKYFFASQYNSSAYQRTAQSLRTKSEEFEALAQNVSQLAWMAHPDGRIYWYNRRWYEYTGTTFETMQGWGWRSVHLPDQVDRIVADVAMRWEAGQAFEGVYWLRSAAGQYRPFLTRVEPIRDAGGELVRWFGTNTDISLQLEAEQRLDALIRSSSEVRFRTSADWSELHDLAGGDFIPDTTAANRNWLQDYVPESDRDAVRTEYERAIRTKTTYAIEHRVNRVDGSTGWAQTRAVPLFDHEGTITGWFGAASDITDRKHAEAALRELNETLEQRVTDALASRMEVEEQLRQSQKMEVVGQLTGGVAHDFNNLLTVIRSSVDLLKRPNLTEERRARYVDAISETADRAAKLTSQLLAFSRRQTLQPVTFAANEGVDKLRGMLGTLIGSRIAIEIELSDQACFVRADPSQFDTALVNMAVNARDAMDGSGRVHIAIRAVDSMPALRAHPPTPGPFVSVSITDTGSGIAPEQIDHIFEPFFTTKGAGKGTGLGLSQVFGFAKQSGGDISVESRIGEGTTFTLFLPRVAAEARMDGDAEPVPLVDGHGTRVLVVEDNADVGAFATQSLTELGYETDWAANADEALAKLAENPARFDVVFSDVVMAGMSGIELGQEIRRRYHDLPVVLTSGYSHVLAQNGTYGFELLHKPYSIEQLSRVLHRSIAWRGRKQTEGE